MNIYLLNDLNGLCQMGHFKLIQINWRARYVYCGSCESTAYDMFLIMSLLDRPIYDLNPLRLNPNPQKPVSCLQVGSNINTLTSHLEFVIKLL